MGSKETAFTIPGEPRVIYVFYGKGAPSGPIYLLFSDVDRLSDSLWDRSVVGQSPTPHALALEALQRALDRNLWQIMAKSNGAQRTLPICMQRWEPPRMRRRRLPTSSSDPRRPQGDLRTKNRQDSTGAAGLELPGSAARPREVPTPSTQPSRRWRAGRVRVKLR